MAVFAVVAMVLSLGAAFAGDLQAADGSKPYNGITHFDLGPASTCRDSAAAEQGLEMKPYNGITYFGQGQAGSGSKNYNCVGEARVAVNKPYNGITVF